MSKKECRGQKLSLLHTDTTPWNIRLCLGVMGILLLTSEAPWLGLPKALPRLLLELFPPSSPDVVPLFSIGIDHQPSKLLLFLCLVKSIGKKIPLMSMSIDQMVSPVVLHFASLLVVAYKTPQSPVCRLDGRAELYLYAAQGSQRALFYGLPAISAWECNKGMQAR